MPVSNFPNGFSHGVAIRGVPLLNTHAGNFYWVDSGTGSNGNNGTFGMPFATLAYALTRCTASNGDVIVLFPGHAETVATATALDINVAGVSILGAPSVGALRPTFTVGTAATATVTVSAANCSAENVLFVAALDGLNSTLTVTGANCYLDIEHQDTSSTVEADIAITVTGDKFTCNLRDIGFAGGDQRDQSITLNAVDNARINIDFYGKVGTAVVDMITASCTDVEVRGTMYVSGTTDGSLNVKDTIGSSTWFMDVVDAAAGARYTGGSGASVASDDISSITAALYGASGIATFPSGVAAASNVSMAEVLRYVQDQVINGTGTVLDTNTSLYGVLAGATGIPTFPAAAEAANNVSLAEVLRMVSDYQTPRIAVKTIASASATLTTGSSPVTLFTVTGDVIARVWATVQTGITTTATTGTLAVGVVGNTGAFLAQIAANTTNLPVNTVWAGDTSATVAAEAFSAAADTWAPIASGADIVCTIATNSCTAGAIKFYCQYIPLDASSSVVAA